MSGKCGWERKREGEKLKGKERAIQKKGVNQNAVTPIIKTLPSTYTTKVFNSEKAYIC